MIGGVLLEVTGRIKPTVTAAVTSTAIYGVTMLFFSFTGNYAVSLTMLLIGGVANLASMSIGQTVVQLRAPAQTAAGWWACTGWRPTGCGPAAGSPWACSARRSASMVARPELGRAVRRTVAAGWYALRRPRDPVLVESEIVTAQQESR